MIKALHQAAVSDGRRVWLSGYGEKAVLVE
jgi:hypothetical protein